MELYQLNMPPVLRPYLIVIDQILFGRDPALQLAAFLIHVVNKNAFLDGKRLLDGRQVRSAGMTRVEF
jgi:hypothetical protein